MWLKPHVRDESRSGNSNLLTTLASFGTKCLNVHTIFDAKCVFFKFQELETLRKVDIVFLTNKNSSVYLTKVNSCGFVLKAY